MRRLVLILLFLVAACEPAPDRLPELPAGGAGGGGAGGGGGMGGSVGGAGGELPLPVPSVRIDAPAASAYVYGSSVVVEAVAECDEALASVLLEVNDAAVVELLEAPATRLDIRQSVPVGLGQNAITIRARGISGGEAAASVTVAADGEEFHRPVIRSFTATPTEVAHQEVVRLQWQVDGTDVVLWIDGVGDVTGTELEVRPVASRTWTLRATNAAGRASAEASVEVAAGPLILRPDAAIVPASGVVPLYVANAGAATLDWQDGAVVAAGGPPSVATWTAPAEPGIYQVRVSTVGEDPPRPASATFEVRAEAPPIAAAFETAGGNFFSVRDPEDEAVVADDGAIWIIVQSAPRLLRFDTVADRWLPVATPFDPVALARTADGTIWIGSPAEGVARLVAGNGPWELVGTGSGATLATRGDTIYRVDRSESDARIAQFVAGNWVAEGPHIPVADIARYAVDGAGNHWVAAGSGELLMLPSGGAAWQTAAHPLPSVTMLQAGPGDRLLVAYRDGVAIHAGGSWTDRTGDLPAGARIHGIGFQADGTAAVNVSGGGKETAWVEDPSGVFAPRPSIGGVPTTASLLRGGADGTLLRIGSQGTYRLRPDASAWELVGGRGLGRFTRVVSSRSGALVAFSRESFLMGPNGRWQSIELPTGEDVEEVFEGEAGFIVLQRDGTLSRVSDSGEVELEATLDPAILGSVHNGIEGSDGTVFLLNLVASLRVPPGGSPAELIVGGHDFHDLAAQPGSGRIWGISRGRDRSGSYRLEVGARTWDRGLAFAFPAFDAASEPVASVATAASLYLAQAQTVCAAAWGQGACEPIASHLLGAPIVHMTHDAAAGGLYVLANGQVFLLDEVTGIWRRLESVPGNIRQIIAVGGWLYAVTPSDGLWRMSLAGR